MTRMSIRFADWSTITGNAVEHNLRTIEDLPDGQEELPCL